MMLCGWEGNRRSGLALWPRVTDFSGLSTYGFIREMNTLLVDEAHLTFSLLDGEWGKYA